MHIIDHPESFKAGVRLIMRVWRNKENKEGRRPGRTEVSTCIEEWQHHCWQLVQECVPGERVYASAEPRSIPHAIRVFKERQLAADYDPPAVRDAFYATLSTRWLSCLGAPQASAEKFFLFDCDDMDAHKRLCEDLESEQLMENVVHAYRTKNGVHVLTKPFNPGLIKLAHREILQKNALILVAWGK